MKRILVLTLVTSIFSFISACSKKDRLPQSAGADFQGKGPLLQRMEYIAFNAKAEFYYNPDSTQEEIIYSSPSTWNKVTFTYNNKRLIKTYSEGAARTSEYQYNASGQIIRIAMKSLYSTGYYSMEFSYKADGKVNALELYLTNEAGTKLQWSSVYEYDAQGLLTKITATDNKNNRVLYIIEEYSEPCNFNPWSFIDLGSLSPLYDVFNWPVLSAMNRLPKKINKYTGHANPVIESTQATEFIIQSKRIDKTISSLAITGGPVQPDSEVHFKY
jgi:YD repeat-containing protein